MRRGPDPQRQDPPPLASQAPPVAHIPLRALEAVFGTEFLPGLIQVASEMSQEQLVARAGTMMAAGATIVLSAGLVFLMTTQSGWLLLSGLMARPFWAQLDLLAAIKNSEDDPETLQSMVRKGR